MSPPLPLCPCSPLTVLSSLPCASVSVLVANALVALVRAAIAITGTVPAVAALHVPVHVGVLTTKAH